MDGIEESLRRALDGGDPSDPAFRQSIYEASQRAIERMVQARGLDPERAHQERMRLYEVMQRVEAEHSGGSVGEATGHEPVPGGDPRPLPPAQDEWRETGARDWEDFDETGMAPPTPPTPPSGRGADGRQPGSFSPPGDRAGEGAPEEGEVWTPGAGRAKPRHRGRLLPIVAIAAIVLLLALVALWIFGGEDTGSSETGSLVPSTQETAGGATPGPIAWINVFDGADLQRLAAPSGGRIEEVDAQGRQAVRLAGPQGAEGEIVLDLGSGLAGELAGSNVRIEVVAGSPDDGPREFSVRCLFGQTSVCDRQRFATAMREEAFVFDVSVPSDAATPASIAIGPGLSGEGADIDLFSVRMRVL